MLALTDQDLEGLLSPSDIVAAVEWASLQYLQGQAIVPARLHMQLHDNSFLVMPAVSQGSAGVKLVAYIPDNRSRELPMVSGVMILLDATSGSPLAVMNAGALTAQRTGAVGALGVKYLTPAGTSTVGVIGAGRQGIWQAIFASSVRPIDEVFYVCRSPETGQRFVEGVLKHVPSVRLTRCESARALLAKTDVIVTATASSTPVLPDVADVLSGKHFISIGSFRPNMQELPNSCFELAGEIAVDSEAARDEVGDVIGPVKLGLVHRSDVYFIGRAVDGSRNADVNRTTVYKSVGSALYDLYVARAFHEEAMRRGVGHEIAL